MTQVAYIEVRMLQGWQDALRKVKEPLLHEFDMVYEGQGYQDGSTVWCLGFVTYEWDGTDDLENGIDKFLRDRFEFGGWLQIRVTPESELEEDEDELEVGGW